MEQEWFDIEVCIPAQKNEHGDVIAHEHWQILRRDVKDKAEALRNMEHQRNDDRARHAQDVKKGRAAKDSEPTVRAYRAVRFTRQVLEVGEAAAPPPDLSESLE